MELEVELHFPSLVPLSCTPLPRDNRFSLYSRVFEEGQK